MGKTPNPLTHTGTAAFAVKVGCVAQPRTRFVPPDDIFRRPPTRQKPRASPLGDTPYAVRHGKTDRPSEKRILFSDGLCRQGRVCGTATHAFPIFRKDADYGCKRQSNARPNSLPCARAGEGWGGGGGLQNRFPARKRSRSGKAPTLTPPPQAGEGTEAV
ncbi:hypothetical protein [Kingella potus]|uniref:hypothetical protein n=1 Tax=Kingella potus TaxID=265175 RepID=UPI001FD55B7B|nr:hypothetical protein [Kingella potus]UOP01062.1 hypothetical protein LVJ84_01450 [Kingella potus]